METIVVVSSKSFSTYETIKSHDKSWFDEKPEINPKIIYGVSSDKERMKDWDKGRSPI